MKLVIGSSQPSYTRAIDQQSLGNFSTYEFLTSEAPFEDSIAMTQRRIVKGDMKLLPSRLSLEASDFVRSPVIGLLVLDSSKRLPPKDVLDRSWIVKSYRFSNNE
ncbi:hypothetical protein RRF57_004216 [Xylaria bambusicola]|uniref:Protein kinase domain-containing protein n=1 Tax=Xylaria bambusicola TaxID=326684 RepID=A0AAN7ULJ5_9PEZI